MTKEGRKRSNEQKKKIVQDTHGGGNLEIKRRSRRGPRKNDQMCYKIINLEHKVVELEFYILLF